MGARKKAELGTMYDGDHYECPVNSECGQWPSQFDHDCHNVCYRCGRHFKPGQKLFRNGLVSESDFAGMTRHKRCPK